MHLHDHMKSTFRQFGGEYRDEHVALNEYFGHFRSNLHWVILHRQLGIALLVKQFGEAARRPTEIHIEDDMGFIPDSPTDPRLR